jgi:hypothetical protein
MFTLVFVAAEPQTPACSPPLRMHCVFWQLESHTVYVPWPSGEENAWVSPPCFILGLFKNRPRKYGSFLPVVKDKLNYFESIK